MITVTVYLRNSYSRQLEEIEISREEILQLAAKKAEDMYTENFWETILAEEVKVNVNI